MSEGSKKTEHSGAKKGNGAFWGRKNEAKHASNKKRRANDKDPVIKPGGQQINRAL